MKRLLTLALGYAIIAVTVAALVQTIGSAAADQPHIISTPPTRSYQKNAPPSARAARLWTVAGEGGEAAPGQGSADPAPLQTYTFSDGCNTTTCTALGGCLSTLRWCGTPGLYLFHADSAR